MAVISTRDVVPEATAVIIVVAQVVARRDSGPGLTRVP